MYSLFLLVYFYLKRGENGQNTGLGVSRVSNFFCCKGFMHVYNVIFFFIDMKNKINGFYLPCRHPQSLAITS